jgi:hypothetical protein
LSLGENIDSNREKTFNERISLPITNLANERFVAETSRKTKNSLATKRNLGDFINNFAVYGYLKNGKQIVIDDEAAEIVKTIFKMKIDGYSQNSIADELNKQQILCPLEYKKAHGIPVSDRLKLHEKALWSSVSIRRILENPVYNGTMILGKTASYNYKDRRRFLQDVEKMNIFTGLHEPIISNADFEIVQDLLAKDLRTSPNAKTAYPLSSIAICSNCGQILYRESKTARNEHYYACHNKECKSHAFINEKLLNNAVCEALRQYISCVLHVQNMLDNLPNKDYYADKIKADDNRIKQANLKIETLEKRKISAFALKGLSQTEKDKLISGYDFQIAEQKEFIKTLFDKISNMLDCNTRQAKWLDQIRKFADFIDLKRCVVVSMISSIEVSKDNKINIIFRYANEFENLKLVLQSISNIECAEV